MGDDLVVCETHAAVAYHVRRTGEHAINLGGHVQPRPQTLCGLEAAWDTRLPVTWFVSPEPGHLRRCTKCRDAAGEGE